MRDPHVVRLPKQSLALLESAEPISAGQRYVFSSLYRGKRPMSENTIDAALRRLDCSGKKMTAHGFRMMATTLLNESGRWCPDAIERALVRNDGNAVRGTNWQERVEIVQWWSDYLDGPREDGKILAVLTKASSN